MHISEDRLQTLCGVITKTLLNEQFVQVDAPSHLQKIVHQAMVRYVQADAAADTRVRAKIASLKRQVPEGSREWEVLYQQYYDDELRKL